MATHEKEHIEKGIEICAKVAKNLGII